jgi:hypothetical protein
MPLQQPHLARVNPKLDEQGQPLPASRGGIDTQLIFSCQPDATLIPLLRFASVFS